MLRCDVFAVYFSKDLMVCVFLTFTSIIYLLSRKASAPFPLSLFFFFSSFLLFLLFFLFFFFFLGCTSTPRVIACFSTNLVLRFCSYNAFLHHALFPRGILYYLHITKGNEAVYCATAHLLGWIVRRGYGLTRHRGTSRSRMLSSTTGSISTKRR